MESELRDRMFGNFLVLMMELALITPPVGMNLFVVQGIRGEGPVMDVLIGVAPFIAMPTGFTLTAGARPFQTNATLFRASKEALLLTSL